MEELRAWQHIQKSQSILLDGNFRALQRNLILVANATVLILLRKKIWVPNKWTQICSSMPFQWTIDNLVGGFLQCFTARPLAVPIWIVKRACFCIDYVHLSGNAAMPFF